MADAEGVRIAFRRGHRYGVGVAQRTIRRSNLAAVELKVQRAAAAAAREGDFEGIAGVSVVLPAVHRKRGLRNAGRRSNNGLRGCRVVGCVARFVDADGVALAREGVDVNQIDIRFSGLEAGGAAFVRRNGDGSAAASAGNGHLEGAARGCRFVPVLNLNRLLRSLAALPVVGVRLGGFITFRPAHECPEGIAAGGRYGYGVVRFVGAGCRVHHAAACGKVDLRAGYAARDANGERVVAVLRVRPAGYAEGRRARLLRDAAGKRGCRIITIIPCARNTQRVGTNRVDGDFVLIGGELFAGAAGGGKR